MIWKDFGWEWEDLSCLVFLFEIMIIVVFLFLVSVDLNKLIEKIFNVLNL